MFKSTLIFAPHMDDEVLSTGCLILNRVRAGHRVKVVTVFGRQYDYGGITEEQSFEEQSKCFMNAASVLGYSEMACYNTPEGEPSKVGYVSLLCIVEKELEAFLKPEEGTPEKGAKEHQRVYREVVIPSMYDLNQDHKHLHEVCRIALRAGTIPSGPFRILASHGFDRTTDVRPDWLVEHDEKDLALKLRAYHCYHSEVRTGYHPRSDQKIEAQHTVWGALCNADLAEGYTLILNKE